MAIRQGCLCRDSLDYLSPACFRILLSKFCNISLTLINKHPPYTITPEIICFNHTYVKLTGEGAKGRLPANCLPCQGDVLFGMSLWCARDRP